MNWTTLATTSFWKPTFVVSNGINMIRSSGLNSRNASWMCWQSRSRCASVRSSRIIKAADLNVPENVTKEMFDQSSTSRVVLWLTLSHEKRSDPTSNSAEEYSEWSHELKRRKEFYEDEDFAIFLNLSYHGAKKCAGTDDSAGFEWRLDGDTNVVIVG